MDKSTRGFLFISCCFIIGFLILLNFLVFPGENWSIYTAVLLLSPAYFFLADGSKHLRSYSLVTSVLIIAVLALTNYFESPEYAWILFAIPAILAWPIIIFGGKYSAKFGYSFLMSTLLVLCYIGLNIYFEPRFPFSIFTTFAIYWWPLSVALARFPRAFSVIGTIWLTLFFIVTNFVTTDVIWCVYPVFAVLFWPLSMFFARHIFTYSILCTMLVSAFFIVVNWLTTPEIIWAIYPIFAVIWWPLSIYFFVYRRRNVKQKFS
ncbi:hypothetical protein [Listeria sp. ILCC797]|uniref:hypothetical protein n=1 Tax=Listeria sp. ILCC797 TaxID=1918333 RepID=UPI000B596DBF|nr:hypothetical protein [Listeria sp. ILCC797]